MLTIEEIQNRKMIARDVISQLRIGKLVATPMTVCDVVRLDTRLNFLVSEIGQEVRDVLSVETTKCNVCAKGAVFIATIMRFDNLPVTPVIANEGLGNTAYKSEYPGAVFTHGEMEEMESNFEGFGAVEWKDRFGDARERLIAMMENVIRNGEFIVADLPE